MTLKERIRAGVIVAIALIAIGFVFLGNQRPVHAQTTPSGPRIVCFVFSTLDDIGNPIPNLITTGCPATPTPVGALKVMKIVVGGTAVSSNFQIHVVRNGGTDISGSPQAGSVSGTTYVGITPGDYTVSESGGPSGYTAAFSGDCNSSGSVTVASSTVPSTCTITNTYSGGVTPPSTGVLAVKKIISGGTATPSMFSFTINSGSATAFEASGENDITEAPGSYTIAEVATSTYTATYSNCSEVSVTAGATSTCTITNTYVPPVTPPSSSSDVALTKTVDNAAPNIGDTVTYTITASDTGADATGVVVQDILPSGLTFVSTSSADTVGVYASSTGLWTIGKLASTTPATLHIMATVNSGLGNGTVITNMATVTAGDTSSNSENNSSSAPVTVTIPSSNTGGGGGGVTPTTGGGGNGPIIGSYGGGGNGPIPIPTSGQVLGASTSTIPASCSQYLTAFIKSGQKNDMAQVKRLQTFLNTYEGGHLTVSGVYDAATLAATEAFQQKYGSDILTPWGIKAPTGYVYLTTRKEINTIYCHFTQNFPLTASEQAIISATVHAVGHAVKTTGVPTHLRITTSVSGTSSASSTSTGASQAAAAAAAGAGTTGSSSAVTGSTSAPVTNNPFNNIGNFFRHLFSR